MVGKTAPPPPVVVDGDLDPSRYAHLAPPAVDTAPTLAQLAHRARSIAGRPGDWRHLVRFDAESRWRIRLHREPTYEVWLMSWLPGQRTGPHDHGDSAVVIALAAGELQEHSIPSNALVPRVHTIGIEQVRIWGARHVREIVNAGTVPAVSVHVYSPPPG